MREGRWLGLLDMPLRDSRPRTLRPALDRSPLIGLALCAGGRAATNVGDRPWPFRSLGHGTSSRMLHVRAGLERDRLPKPTSADCVFLSPTPQHSTRPLAITAQLVFQPTAIAMAPWAEVASAVTWVSESRDASAVASSMPHL